MQSTFTLKKDELNIDFIKGLKKIFKGNILAITVSTIPTPQMTKLNIF